MMITTLSYSNCKSSGPIDIKASDSELMIFHMKHVVAYTSPKSGCSGTANNQDSIRRMYSFSVHLNSIPHKLVLHKIKIPQ